MAFFTRETMRFLKDLAQHNDKAWFDANKARYEAHVKEPSARFAAAVGPKLGLEPRVMRIYRDVRFSKDKTPYKTNIGIGFGHAAAIASPGYFLHLAPGESAIYAGVWRPEPPALHAIRDAILESPTAWRKARAVGLSDEGDSLKRPPRGVQADHPFVEDLKRRSFTAAAAFSLADVTVEDFDKRFVLEAKKLAPLNAFLAKALGRE